MCKRGEKFINSVPLETRVQKGKYREREREKERDHTKAKNLKRGKLEEKDFWREREKGIGIATFSLQIYEMVWFGIEISRRRLNKQSMKNKITYHIFN